MKSKKTPAAERPSEFGDESGYPPTRLEREAMRDAEAAARERERDVTDSLHTMLVTAETAIVQLSDVVNTLREQAQKEGRAYCWQAELLRPVIESLTAAFWTSGGCNLPEVEGFEDLRWGRIRSAERPRDLDIPF